MEITFEHKNIISRNRGRILTDLLVQVLVGESEDEILIYQEHDVGWGFSNKNATTFALRNKN